MLKKIMYWSLFNQIIFIFGLATFAFCGNIKLEWDPNVPTPDGYLVYATTENVPFDYSSPAWEGTETECSLTIPDNVAHIFCVRAFTGEAVSGDSNWVYFTSELQPDAIHVPSRVKRLVLEFE